jgi:hypothetical protein
MILYRAITEALLINLHRRLLKSSVPAASKAFGTLRSKRNYSVVGVQLLNPVITQCRIVYRSARGAFIKWQFESSFRKYAGQH